MCILCFSEWKEKCLLQSLRNPSELKPFVFDTAVAEMSEFAEDEVELQSLVKQFLRSISDKISSAPSPECAEEILLHLEETDKNFHK